MYPALAVQSALKLKLPAVDTLWVGAEGGMEAEIVKRAGIPMNVIPAAGLHGVGLRALPRNMFRLLRGLFASLKILSSFQPDVLLFTGGYLAAPMVLAGRNRPILLFMPDIEPGLALRFVAYFANRIAVTAQKTREYFRSRKPILVSGYPVRSDLAGWDRAKANHYFRLDPGIPTLLFLGGSKGARTINQAVLKNLPEFLGKTQLIHISGTLDWESVESASKSLDPDLARRYHPMAYLHAMGAALGAADLVISRAGASVLGEYPFFGLPAILVPYPHAWRYQRVNAEYLAQRGAAIILEDDRLTDRLLHLVGQLMDQPGQLAGMRSAMRALAQPGAAELIADQLIELTESRR